MDYKIVWLLTYGSLCVPYGLHLLKESKLHKFLLDLLVRLTLDETGTLKLYLCLIEPHARKTIGEVELY
jgi:hypothetical protein